MTYTIETAQAGEELFEVRVFVAADDGATLVEGVTHVVTADDAVARAYAETVFLPDLRRNDKRLADLVLPGDAPAEEVPLDAEYPA